ncbi:MAG: DUF5606 domain-containing protein [Bacteroidota bacterium]|nr:DUF5606 domain-containing protein [Bacteroidota bacterium]
MDLSKILSISGQSSLFKLVGHTKSGAIVEFLKENKRFPIYASHKVSVLSDISVYTEEDVVSLEEVFKRIYKKEEGKPTIDPKSDNDILKKYFEEVIPEYDKERVYISDIKKVLTWYNQLQEVNLLVFDEEKNEENNSEDKEEKK